MKDEIENKNITKPNREVSKHFLKSTLSTTILAGVPRNPDS